MHDAARVVPAHPPTRMIETLYSSALEGTVRWAPAKSIWYNTHLLLGLTGVLLFFSWPALLVFVGLTVLTICLGHSLGMHRRLIHRSYECPLLLEYLFVYCGVLVGMAGPIGMVYQHDLRDWAQRQPKCHDFLKHGSHTGRDFWWQLNCDVDLDNPPVFAPEERVIQDKFYLFLERTWMIQQLPLAILLVMYGGLQWLLWGISLRIAVSLSGHWFIGYLAHNTGQRNWHVNGAAVQGHNILYAGIFTMGECWHNNHHAFPESAKLGLYSNQADPGWWVLVGLTQLGLVWSMKLPVDLPCRPELVEICKGEGLSPNAAIGTNK